MLRTTLPIMQIDNNLHKTKEIPMSFMSRLLVLALCFQAQSGGGGRGTQTLFLKVIATKA